MKRNFKKVLSVFIAILMLVSAVPMNNVVGTDLFATKASAETLAPTGQCGENVYWTFDSETGLLTISGEGKMTDYTFSSSPFYNDTIIKSVAIEDSVTHIGKYTFCECTGMNEVTFSDSVTSLGDNSFCYCSNLEEVILPDSITSIGTWAFAGCYNLRNIKLPESLTKISNLMLSNCRNLESIFIPSRVNYIGTGAFEKCIGLKSMEVSHQNKYYDSRNDCNAIIQTSNNDLIKGCTNTVIPDGVTGISSSAFQWCLGFKSMTIPNSVKAIGQAAFEYCDDLTDITIPASVERIGQWAFRECESLTNVTILGNNLQYIGSGAFSGCYKLKNASLPDSVTEIGSESFDGCYRLSDFQIPDSVTNIGRMAFRECRAIDNIVIPNGVTTINEETFRSCENLTNINIPDTVTSIGNMAFSSCKKLQSISIPNSVTSIGSSAFRYCTGLTKIEVGSGNTKYCSDERGVLFNKDKTTLIQYPAGNTSTSYNIPNSVTSIGSYAFYYCTGLTSITIPDSVTSIDSSAFYGCTGLTNITIPNSVTNIGGSAFEYCTGLTSITIPDSVTSIGDRTFYECTGLASITIPDSVTSIGDRAFVKCSSLTSITIPDSVTSIGDRAFYECTGLASITIPDIITSIGEGAFYGCTGLTSITIPDSVTSIGDYAFYHTAVKDVYYAGDETQWNSISIGTNNDPLSSATIHYNYGKVTGKCGDGANWAYDESDKSLLISGKGAMDSNASFDDYGWYSFKNEIEYVKVADGVTSVGANAFSGCAGLKEVYLGDSVTAIGENAFADCAKLSLVTVTSKSFSAENAFSGNSKNLSFVVADGNSNALKFVQDNKIPSVKLALDDKTIDFIGNTIIYSELDYNYLNEIINKHSNAEKIHFGSLEFDGIKVEKEVISIFDDIDIDEKAENLVLKDLYLKIQLEKDGKTEFVSFAKMFELLESEDYDTFKLFIDAEDVSVIKVIFQQITEFFNEIGTSALRVITKAVNFVAGIFKKK